MPIITGGGNLSLTVQVCFNQDPNDPSPPTAVWTDITQRCKTIGWSRGRQYELDKVEPGTFTAQVNNDDGALTPGNFGSAYYPGVVLYRQLQVIAVYQSVTYVLFTGFVTQWPQNYAQAGQRPSTTLAAVDALGLLALFDLKGWGVDAYSLLGCSALYPLNDAAGATLFGASIGSGPPGRAIAPVGSVTPGASFDATMPGFSGRSFTTFANANTTTPGAYITLPNGLLPSVGAFTVSLWFNYLATGSGVPSLFMARDRDEHVSGATVSQIYAVHYGDGSIGVTARNYDPVNGTSYNSATLPLAGDGAWHMLAVSLSSDRKTVRCSLDGAAPLTVVTSSTAMAFSLPLLDLAISGSPLAVSSGGSMGGVYGYTGSLANLAIFPADLCSDLTNPLATLYTAGRTAFAGESTGTRAQRIATVAGFGAKFTSY